MAMKDMILPHSSTSKPGCSSSSPTMHKNSRVISKFKPKIHIIHIFAPEIVKTDASNFRELVQRLTGKPAGSKVDNRKKKTTKKAPSTSLDLDMHNTAFINDTASDKSVQLQGDEWVINGEKMIKEEDNETWDNGDNNTPSSFLDEFADLDGFIQDLNDSSSYIPKKSSHPRMGYV